MKYGQNMTFYLNKAYKDTALLWSQGPAYIKFEIKGCDKENNHLDQNLMLGNTAFVVFR